MRTCNAINGWQVLISFGKNIFVAFKLLQWSNDSDQSVRAGRPRSFLDWLKSLRDIQARARIRTRLDRLALGNWGDHRALGGGATELKIDWGPGYRVYVGKIGNTLVLLLCGGDKRTQQQDIELAKIYLKEYLDEQS